MRGTSATSVSSPPLPSPPCGPSQARHAAGVGGRAPGWAPGNRRERARVPEDQGRPGDPRDTKSRASGLCLHLVALKAEATARRAKIWP